MPIAFSCTHCRSRISVSRKSAGKRGKCPRCGNIVFVPGIRQAGAELEDTDALEKKRAPPSDSRRKAKAATQKETHAKGGVPYWVLALALVSVGSIGAFEIVAYEKRKEAALVARNRTEEQEALKNYRKSLSDLAKELETGRDASAFEKRADEAELSWQQAELQWRQAAPPGRFPLQEYAELHALMRFDREQLQKRRDELARKIRLFDVGGHVPRVVIHPDGRVERGGRTTGFLLIKHDGVQKKEIVLEPDDEIHVAHTAPGHRGNTGMVTKGQGHSRELILRTPSSEHELHCSRDGNVLVHRTTIDFRVQTKELFEILPNGEIRTRLDPSKTDRVLARVAPCLPDKWWIVAAYLCFFEMY